MRVDSNEVVVCEMMLESRTSARSGSKARLRLVCSAAAHKFRPRWPKVKAAAVLGLAERLCSRWGGKRIGLEE